MDSNLLHKQAKFGTIHYWEITVFVLGQFYSHALYIYVQEASTDEPFSFDVGHSANVVLGREYKLVVQNPLRLVIQTGRRM